MAKVGCWLGTSSGSASIARCMGRGVIGERKKKVLFNSGIQLLILSEQEATEAIFKLKAKGYTWRVGKGLGVGLMTPDGRKCVLGKGEYLEGLWYGEPEILKDLEEKK